DGFHGRSARGGESLYPQILTGLFDLLDFQEAVQLADAGGMPHFSEPLGFDLANALARDAKLFSDFLHPPPVSLTPPASHFQNFPLAFGEAAKHIAQLVFQQAEAGDVRRTFGGFVFDEISKTVVVAVADR